MINKVILLGNLGQDPEIRKTESGHDWASFSVATTERGYTNSKGVSVPERTMWHNVVAWGSVVKVIDQYLHKGDQVYIEGKIDYYEYEDKDKMRRRGVRIILDVLKLLGKRAGNSEKNANLEVNTTAEDERLPF